MSNVNNFIIGLVCVLFFALSIFGSGYYCGYKAKPGVKDIKPVGQVDDNKVKKDPTKMPDAEKNKDLLCYFKAEPTLDLKLDSYKRNRVTAYASLCDRNWHQNFDLNLSEPKNMIMLSFVTVYDNQDKKLAIGGQISYYRLFGNFGIGGGFLYLNNQTYGTNVGVIYKF